MAKAYSSGNDDRYDVFEALGKGGLYNVLSRRAVAALYELQKTAKTADNAVSAPSQGALRAHQRIHIKDLSFYV